MRRGRRWRALTHLSRLADVQVEQHVLLVAVLLQDLQRDEFPAFKKQTNKWTVQFEYGTAPSIDGGQLCHWQVIERVDPEQH